jgi:hypothetical protein
MGDFAIMSGISRATTYIVAAIAGIAASASIRGANVLLGPVNVVFQGVPPVALPEAARLAKRSSRALLITMIGLSAALALVALGCGLLLLALPDSFGTTLLSDTWQHARRVVLPLTLALAASALSTGAMIGIRALAQATRMFRTRAFTAPIIATSVVVGAVVGGAVGAAVGNAAGTLVADVIWWQQFLLALRHPLDD